MSNKMIIYYYKFKKGGIKMQIKGLEKLNKLCKCLGLKTLIELERVYKLEHKQGEAVITTLERIKSEREKLKG